VSTYPSPAKVTIGADRIVRATLSRPRPYYCRGDTQRLAVGEILVTVTFNTPLRDANWVFAGLTIVNSADSLIDVPDITITGRSQKSASGFTVKLSAAPLSDNFYLDWNIAEKYNP